jgi:hypothetical protein
MSVYTISAVVAAGILTVIILLWVVWKFFSKLFKFFAIALIAVVAWAGIYILRTQSARDPSIGKHAYLTENGKYLGVVEGAGEDNQRGRVWIIRPPGRYPLMYSKTRVTLKDKREIEKEPKEEPSPNPSASPGSGKGKKKGSPRKKG